MRSKIKISDIKLHVRLNLMSELNVRNWHKFIISSHFSNKISQVKIKPESTLVPGYF